MCIVPLCNNALHDFMDDDTFWVLRRIGIFQPYNSGDCWVNDRLWNFEVSLEALTSLLFYEIQGNGPLRAKTSPD